MTATRSVRQKGTPYERSSALSKMFPSGPRSLRPFGPDAITEPDENKALALPTQALEFHWPNVTLGLLPSRLPMIEDFLLCL